MRKEEFLSTLRSQLAGLPKEDIEEQIEFYSEAIDDRIEEGQSEEEAVRAVGGVDQAVTQIAENTPLSKLVKEKVVPKRKISAFEVILIILGFPLWFPLLVTAFVLFLVFYLLVWVLVLVVYSIELAFMSSSVGSLVLLFYGLSQGIFEPMYIAIFILGLGLSIAFFFVCIGSTKITIKLSKKILLGIKKKFMRRGNKWVKVKLYY